MTKMTLGALAACNVTYWLTAKMITTVTTALHLAAGGMGVTYTKDQDGKR